MDIKLRYFAILREKLGCDEELATLADQPWTVALLWQWLIERHPALEPWQHHVRVSVNLRFASADTPLQHGDEVALIPPVAGGQTDLLTTHPIDPNALIALVTRPEAGAVVTFQGVVRNHHQQRSVSALEYQVYPEMAQASLLEIQREIETEFAQTRCAICHRYGMLQIGDIAVVIAVSSPHRAEAFAACAEAIDRIKQRVPIWKKEWGPDGGIWIGEGMERA